MTGAQTVTKAITQAAIKATKVALQAMAVAGAETETRQRSKAMSTGIKLGRPSLKQPSFNWRTRAIYT